MNIKTMEGLVGAHTNMDLAKVPVRVYMEARRRGDNGTMERAMGYAGDFTDKAKEYQEKADKGMEEEAKETREKKRLEQEEAAAKRRAEREMQEKALADAAKNAGTVEISEEGRKLLEQAEGNNAETNNTEADSIEINNLKINSMKSDNINENNINTNNINTNNIKADHTKNTGQNRTGGRIPAIQEPVISITL